MTTIKTEKFCSPQNIPLNPFAFNPFSQPQQPPICFLWLQFCLF